MMRVLAAFATLLALASPLRAEIAIQEVLSPNGVRAWLIEDHSIPFAALELRFKGGTSLDPSGKRGAINLMTALIEEGAGDLDAQGFAAARDDLAASFGFSADRDGLAVSVQILTENRAQAVDLLSLALAKPRFDQDAVDRVRGQVLAGLSADAKDPDAMASIAEAAALFGAHPYGSDASGTPSSVAALTRADIVAAHGLALDKSRVIIGAAGDISAADLGALIDQVLADLPAAGTPLPPPAPIQALGGTEVIAFDGPQSVLRFAHEGIPVKDPDFMAASLVNEIFGGNRFSARLMTELREKRGLTYGVGVGLAGLDGAALVMGAVQASNDKVGEAVQVLRDEWEKIAAGDITESELEAAKTYMIGAYPLRFDGNAAIAGILVGMQENGYPVDYPKTRNARVAAITLDEANRVARRLYRPKALHFTIVGTPKGVLAE